MLTAFLAFIGSVAALGFAADARYEKIARLGIIPIAIGVAAIAYRFCGYEKNSSQGTDEK
jgi:hypothetical protein